MRAYFSALLLTVTIATSCSPNGSLNETASKPESEILVESQLDAVRVTASPPDQTPSLHSELESYFQTDISPRVNAYVRHAMLIQATTCNKTKY
jgi:hypothetical protein